MGTLPDGFRCVSHSFVAGGRHIQGQATWSGMRVLRLRGRRERLSDGRGAAPIVGKCFRPGGLLTTTQVVGNKASVSVEQQSHTGPRRVLQRSVLHVQNMPQRSRASCPENMPQRRRASRAVHHTEGPDHPRKYPSSARVAGSSALASPPASAVSTDLAITLPYSTPNWSKALMPRITLATKVACS